MVTLGIIFSIRCVRRLFMLHHCPVSGSRHQGLLSPDYDLARNEPQELGISQPFNFQDACPVLVRVIAASLATSKSHTASSANFVYSSHRIYPLVRKCEHHFRLLYRIQPSNESPYLRRDVVINIFSLTSTEVIGRTVRCF